MQNPLLVILMTDLRARGISQRTIDTYSRISAGFLASHEEITSISRATVADWVYSADTKSKQRHRYLAVNALCRALANDGLLETNPCGQIKMPVEAEAPQPTLTDGEFVALVRSCDLKTKMGRRD